MDEFVLTRSPFDVYYFYFIYILIIGIYFISTKSVVINKYFLLSVVAVCAVSFIQARLNQYPITPVVKQLISILISSIPFYLILKLNQFDVRKLFKIYLNVTMVICWLGILQVLAALLLGMEFRYGYKLTSIVSEPAHLAITLAPAFFVALNKLLFKSHSDLISKKTSVLIVITWLLTMSAVAMLGLVAAVAILAVNKFNILSYRLSIKNLVRSIVVISVSALLIFFVYSKVEFIRYRVDDTWSTLTAKEGKKIGSVNLSTYTIYINYLITKEGLFHNFFLGSGIGTHSLNYNRYIDWVYNFESQDYRQFEWNKEDANSLLLRLLSELGVLGALAFLVVLYKFNIRKVPAFAPFPLPDLWLINNGCLLFFVMRLIRFGNYSVLGFFLFAFIYYYTYKSNSTLTLRTESNE